MTDGTNPGGSRGTILVLVLAFLVIFLAVRISFVNDERDAAHEAFTAARKDAEEARRARDAAVGEQALAQDRVLAQEARRKTVDAMNEQALAEQKAAAEALRTDRDRLAARLAEVAAERDRAAAAHLDVGDRLVRTEETLIRRERDLIAVRRELAEKDAEIAKLRDPSEVERASVLLASADRRIRGVGLERMKGLRDAPGAADAFRAALRRSEDVAEALTVLDAAGETTVRRLASAEASSERVAVRRAVCRVVEDAETLERLLGDSDPFVRGAAATRIGELRMDGTTAALRARAGDPDAAVRSAVALALARHEDWPSVTALLADSDIRVARCALAGFVAAGQPLPVGIEVHPDLSAAVELSRRLLSLRSESD